MGILAFLKSLFGGKSENTQSATRSGLTQGGNGQHVIRYDPNLVSKLKGDHQRLLADWTNVLELAKAQNWAETRSALEGFGQRLNAHLTLENIRFYAYVDYELRDDPEASHVISEFKKEMLSIGRTVSGFLESYTKSHTDWSDEQISALPATLEAITAALASRIEREEKTLYPLYHG